jgi:hypothetical protein
MASTVPNFQAANVKNLALNRAAVKKAACSRGTEGVGMKDIIRLTGLSKATCQKHIYALESFGHIERTAVTGHTVRYGPKGTWAAHAEVREKTEQQVIKYGCKQWESHAATEAWANHIPVHRVVPASNATPLCPAGPASVWGLAA